MPKTQSQYEVLFYLQDGHRIFSKKDTSGYLIADNSGHDPEHTDDGELFLDFTRNLSIEQEKDETYCSIPLTHDGVPTRTISTPATLLYLASTFDWKIAVKCSADHSFDVRAFIS